MDANTSGSHTVETQSRLWAWWLKTFGGYRLDNVTRTPEMRSFGRIGYRSIYRLRLESSESGVD